MQMGDQLYSMDSYLHTGLQTCIKSWCPSSIAPHLGSLNRQEQGREEIFYGIKVNCTDTKDRYYLLASGPQTRRSVDVMSVKMLLMST